MDEPHEHQVWAQLPDGDAVEFIAAFELNRWQWAEKLMGILDGRGCTHVELKTVPKTEKKRGGRKH